MTLTGRLRHCLRPTLVRRVLLVQLVAVALTWLLLLAYLSSEFFDSHSLDRDLTAIGGTIAASVAAAGNEAEARVALDASAAMLHNSYRANQIPGVRLLQLADGQGRRLHTAPAGVGVALPGDSARLTNLLIDGHQYRVFQRSAGPWLVTLAQPLIAKSWAVRMVAGDLAFDMVIAFPLFLLPIWIGVARGMRPLRALSERIAARGADDLRPLGIDSKYAELKPLASAIDSLLAQLGHKVQRERAFVQDAAHELRTPMAVISAQAHALARADDPHQRADAEQRLDRAIGRASHLVQQLLELAQIDREQAPASTPLDLAQLVRQELAQLAPAAMARDIELSLEAPDNLAQALELHAFQSVLQNLLTNALRYVHSGGEVVVELARRDGALVLSVADNGPGIATAERELVFERFYRGAGHDAAGTGLGLAIATQAAARLGGRLTLGPGLGGAGCTFTARFPA